VAASGEPRTATPLAASKNSIAQHAPWHQRKGTIRSPCIWRTERKMLIPRGGGGGFDTPTLTCADAAPSVCGVCGPHGAAVYDSAGTNGWFGIALDPDGSSFWATDGAQANVCHFSLAGGPPIASFASGAVPCVPGSSSFPLGGVAIVPSTGGGGGAFAPSSGLIEMVPNEHPSQLPGEDLIGKI
jgi:hypothetical protein